MLGGERSEGAISADGNIAGTYLHGLFDTPDACAALVQWAGLESASTIDVGALQEESIALLADAIREHLDVPALVRITGLPD